MMDSDVQKIMDAAEIMKDCFKRLEARKILPLEQQNTVRSAANTFRWFEEVDISLLRAAFDAEYAEEIKRLNLMAKTK